MARILVKYMKANAMVPGNLSLIQELFMKVNGVVIKCMDGVDSLTVMVIFILVPGSTAWLKAMASVSTPAVLNTLANGNTISSMVEAWKLLSMVLPLMANLVQA